ncbi:MAG: phosphatase PAP2 family protein [Clostridia bacterium]|nr:phosphatase PAP2 family protein [Clostridia bacterium]
MELIQSIDRSVLDSIVNIFSCPLLDNVMPIISAIGNGGALYIVLALILMVFKRTRKYGIMLGIALTLGLIFGNLFLKNIVARQRPFGTDCELLIKAPDDYSFPSGHTMASFEMATVMFYMNRKIGYLAIAIATLVAFSRLYLYVHFPTDVLCGCVIGIIIGIISIKLYEKISKKNSL